MSAPETLKKLIGNWSGSNRLWLSPQEPFRESETKARVATVAGGQFMTIQYTWADDSRPQEGLLLIGVEERPNLIHAVWIDSWHMGDKFMLCQGQITDNGNVSVAGLYAAPSAPDWGWRIEIKAGAMELFELAMYNISPEGSEALAVRASYQRG